MCRRTPSTYPGYPPTAARRHRRFLHQRDHEPGADTCGQSSSSRHAGGAASPALPVLQCDLRVDDPACNTSTVSFALGLREFGPRPLAATLTGRYPGYFNCSCPLSSSCSTTFSSTACYALASACARCAFGDPGYNSFTCSIGSNAGCNGVVRVCGDANTYNNTTLCASGGNTHLPGYPSYSCASTSTTACGTGNNREWTITGISSNQAYSSIIGSGKRWGMFSTPAGGATYSMTGHGGNSYRVLGHATTTTYEMYGSKLVTTASPTGTFSTTSGNYADEWAHFLYQTDLGQATGQQKHHHLRHRCVQGHAGSPRDQAADEHGTCRRRKVLRRVRRGRDPGCPAPHHGRDPVGKTACSLRPACP